MPTEKQVESGPLDDENGNTYKITQQNQSPQVAEGGGEFPSTKTAPQAPAPGSAGE